MKPILLFLPHAVQQLVLLSGVFREPLSVATLLTIGLSGGTPLPQVQEQYACLPLLLRDSTVSAPTTVSAITA